MKVICRVFILLGLVFYSQIAVLQTEISSLTLTNFELQSSAIIPEGGAELTQGNYQDKAYWHPVKVPSTVLSGLVANGVYPNPYHGLNNMLIPDASDSFNLAYNLEKYSHLPDEPNPWKKPYWYRTKFRLDRAETNRRHHLIFKGINYRAEVWLNGKQVADSSQMAGMFAEYSFDVSDLVRFDDDNLLAVKIFPLDYPGLPAPEQLKALDDFYMNGGPTGDIGKNVTMLCSVGWDWIPPVRDRNMGIWQPVLIHSTGDAIIEHPQITTSLPNLPDTSVARLTVRADVHNSSAQDKKVTVALKLSPHTFTGSSIDLAKEITIPASSRMELTLDATDHPALEIDNPRLWWPSGYGNPDLYQVDIDVYIDGILSDHHRSLMGIRSVSSRLVDTPGRTSRREFYVNGKRIFLQGGAWVPDMLLQRDTNRYEQELRMIKNVNANLVRIWGGGITPPDIFFEWADRLGLLIWSDFWVTGDTQGEFKGSEEWPLDGEVFKRNAHSTILRIRNHPSLLIWTGGNEGHARKELYDFMRHSVIELDGTRPFIPSSSGFAKLPHGWEGAWPDGGPAGVFSSGPYQWTKPEVYYDLVDQGRDWVFKDETGIPSQPTLNSLTKIIPNLIWDKKAPFPMNDTWGYHDAATGNGRFDLYYKNMVDQYGAPESVEDYVNKMQLMNAVGYQAIFEAPAHRLSETGGVMLWKLNAAFPSVIWQIYDWYLQPHAGYYFMQNACESLHVQYNRRSKKVEVVNRKHQGHKGLMAKASVYKENATIVWRDSIFLEIGPDQASESLDLSGIDVGDGDVYFILLQLKQDDNIISRNAYWIQKDDLYQSLSRMNKIEIKTELLDKQEEAGNNIWNIKIENPTDQIAFFIQPQVICDGTEIAPAYWDQSYFTLAPGEELITTVTFEKDNCQACLNQLRISGWNVKEVILVP